LIVAPRAAAAVPRLASSPRLTAACRVAHSSVSCRRVCRVVIRRSQSGTSSSSSHLVRIAIAADRHAHDSPLTAESTARRIFGRTRAPQRISATTSSQARSTLGMWHAHDTTRYYSYSSSTHVWSLLVMSHSARMIRVSVRWLTTAPRRHAQYLHALNARVELAPMMSLTFCSSERL
jgi:hypothetical protein